MKWLMGNPTSSDVHVDMALTEICIAYVPEAERYIAEQVFPSVPVDKQSDYYYIWTKGFWLRNAVERRTPGDTYPEGRLELSNTTYFCQPYHLGFPIPDEDKENQDPAVQLEETGAEWLSSQFQLNREILIAATVFSTANWDNYVTGVTNFTQWDDYDDSNPIVQINTAKQTIQKSTGRRANTCVIGQEVLDVLVEHPLLLEKFKYTSPGILDAEQVRQALKVDKLLVGEAVYESTPEGADPATRSYIWGKNAWVGYVPPSAGLRVAAAGYTFELRWPEAGGQVASIRNTREDNRDRDLLKGKYAFDDKVVGKDLGYYIASAVS